MASFKVESLRGEITNFLKGADKSAVSAKAVRKALSSKYPDLDVKTHKAEIDALTVSIFTNDINVPNDDAPVATSSTSPKIDKKPKLPNFNRVKNESPPPSTTYDGGPSSSPAFPIAQTTKPKGVKREREKETDEEMAKRLQAELNGTTGTRSTRNGGATKSRSKVTKKTKKKSKATISDEDDSANEAAGGKPKKKRKVSNTGFNKPHLLSPALAEVCGKQVLSRPAVTKALWVYIKANGLQDPGKKTDILPDEVLKRVFPFERIHSFTMAKHIGSHLYPYDEAEHGHLNEDLIEDTKDDLVHTSDEED